MNFPALLLKVFLLASGLSGLLAQDVFPLRPSEAKPLSNAGANRLSGGQAGTLGTNASFELDAEGAEGATIRKHVIAQGDNLSRIAAKVYGRAGYWRLLKLYNDCDPSKLKIGQVIEVPDLVWWLKEEGVVEKYEEAATALMKGRSLFMLAEEDLLADPAMAAQPPPESVSLISEAQALLAAARDGFATKPEGVTGTPNSALLQLRTASELMGAVAKGDARPSVAMAEVHERLGNALTYCLIWAREGFK